MNNRTSVLVSKSALIHNYQLIERLADKKMLPMIKANAYGHGAIFAAEALKLQKSLYAFGVATFAEAIEVRSVVATVPILVFSDCAPWTDEKFDACRKFNLQPVFSEILSLLQFQKQSGHQIVPAHIEINTGMNRMGIPPESLGLVKFNPQSVFTHLADADSPKSKLTRLQMRCFSDVVALVKALYPRALLHFANSSAIWNAKDFPLFKEMDIVRPGLSLYGVRPYAKAKDQGLKRVMTFKVPVVNKIYLGRGDQVGYGGTYTCKKRSGEWIATLGGGYGDGVFRSLGTGSGKTGFGVYEGTKSKVELVGRVSMDLSAAKATAKVQVGDQFILWGDAIDPYQQADAAGTIPYEIMTRIGFKADTRQERT